jgi:hypothetical protein
MRRRSAAEQGALEIRYPRPLLDKLGVKPGLRVSVLGLRDEGVLSQLRERVPALSEGRLRKDSDLVFAWIGSAAELARLGRLRGSLKPAGALWAIWAKGRRELGEDHIRAAALGAGLVDVKVVSVSDALSGLKLVIPVAQRKG